MDNNNDIQHSLDRIERNQLLLALMMAIFGVCWAFSKVFPIVAQSFS